MKSKLDSEVKIELLIKLAFGLSIDELSKEYDLTAAKITNLRKNNYLKYNEFFQYWKIDKDVATLGLTPKLERALSVVKKFYKNRLKIESAEEIYFDGKSCTMNNIIDIADKILRKDNITTFKELPIYIKNHY